MLNIILFRFSNKFIQHPLHIFWLFMPQYYKLPLLASIMFTVYQQFSPRNADYMSHAYLQLVLLPHQIRFPRAMQRLFSLTYSPSTAHVRLDRSIWQAEIWMWHLQESYCRSFCQACVCSASEYWLGNVIEKEKRTKKDSCKSRRQATWPYCEE